MLDRWKAWIVFALVNAVMGVAFALAICAGPSNAKRPLLPGTTTHGHYQIEMNCNVCHTPGNGVTQDACLKCHEAELSASKDTHAISKFNDPTNADRLKSLDARSCLTCHREHVEDQTSAMGLTVPKDYCYYCHQETLQTRPSHRDFAFDSCATAGCHNYHDNRAIYENFLVKHYGEPDLQETTQTPVRKQATESSGSLGRDSIDAPNNKLTNETLVVEWLDSAHATAAVNCSDCHEHASNSGGKSTSTAAWSDTVATGTCAKCHQNEADAFGQGRHGMRPAQGLTPMQPHMARLAMHTSASHRTLDCNACHGSHRFDTQYAAIEACLNCHADTHSLAYQESSHFEIWKQTQAGDLPEGSGVSCATCHMPRVVTNEGMVAVQHNQNENLRPNEKMIRDVCLHCHGLQFSINALADRELILTCFDSSPSTFVESLEMAKSWFDEKARQRSQRRKKRVDL